MGNSCVIYPYVDTKGKDFKMLRQHIDGIYHMYSGFYTKARNYRPTSTIWNRLKESQRYFDQNTRGWYVRGRKPSWINKASWYIHGTTSTSMRFQSD